LAIGIFWEVTGMSFRGFISDKLVIPSLLRFASCASWPWYEELLRLERADRDELRKSQWERFQSLVEYSKQHVPYYRESFGQIGLRAKDLRAWDDLLAVPAINKRQIAANFPDRITSSHTSRNTWEYIATSGTTDRLMVVIDEETKARSYAVSLYTQKIRGTYAPGCLHVTIPPDACSLACAAAVRRSQGAMGRARHTIAVLTERGVSGFPRSLTGRALRAVAHPACEMASFGTVGTRVLTEMLQWYLDCIRAWRPVVLSGLPTYLDLLARYIERCDETVPAIGSLLPEGALSTPALKDKLIRVFGVPVHEVYGGHEFGSVATTCEHRDKLHIVMTECLVETVRGGKHVAPGEIGEIMVTRFANKTMPLIRYRPGDLGRLYNSSCSCGRQTQLLTLEGRLQDSIVTSRGIRTAKEIIDFFGMWENLEFFQLVQRTENRCDLLVVEDDAGRINLRDLAEATEEFLGDEMKVRPRFASTIKPEESGKFRFVKSRSYQHFHEITPVRTFDSAERSVPDQPLHVHAMKR